MPKRKLVETPADESVIYEIPSVAGKTKQKPEPTHVPDAVIRRLPRYFRFLRELINNDVLRVSSGELAEIMDMTASQIRQDLNCFGCFGQQGYGYNVKYLYSRISEILGVSRKYSAVVIGTGHISSTLISHRVFEQRGIMLKGVFDMREEKIGTSFMDFTVSGLSEFVSFCDENNIDLAIITAPAKVLAEVMPLLEKTSVRGIWNYSLHEIKPYNSKVAVQNIFVGDSLMLLTYEMAEKENEN